MEYKPGISSYAQIISRNSNNNSPSIDDVQSTDEECIPQCKEIMEAIRQNVDSGQVSNIPDLIGELAARSWKCKITEIQEFHQFEIFTILMDYLVDESATPYTIMQICFILQQILPDSPDISNVLIQQGVIQHIFKILERAIQEEKPLLINRILSFFISFVSFSVENRECFLSIATFNFFEYFLTANSDINQNLVLYLFAALQELPFNPNDIDFLLGFYSQFFKMAPCDTWDNLIIGFLNLVSQHFASQIAERGFWTYLNKCLVVLNYKGVKKTFRLFQLIFEETQDIQIDMEILIKHSANKNFKIVRAARDLIMKMIETQPLYVDQFVRNGIFKAVRASLSVGHYLAKKASMQMLLKILQVGPSHSIEVAIDQQVFQPLLELISMNETDVSITVINCLGEAFSKVQNPELLSFLYLQFCNDNKNEEVMELAQSESEELVKVVQMLNNLIEGKGEIQPTNREIEVMGDALWTTEKNMCLEESDDPVRYFGV